MKLDPVETGAGRYLAFETGAQLAAGMVDTDAHRPGLAAR
jgi:hypothetical protein